PRLVLFSPIAQEKHPDPNFPDPAANNHLIQYYVEAMGEVARANGIPFVDLFTASQKAYRQSRQPLTINGIHLSDEGYKTLASTIYQDLLGESATVPDPAAF